MRSQHGVCRKCLCTLTRTNSNYKGRRNGFCLGCHAIHQVLLKEKKQSVNSNTANQSAKEGLNRPMPAFFRDMDWDLSLKYPDFGEKK